MSRKRVVIIGAGISGLACAYRLQELSRETHQDLEILLLEASSRAGGTIQTQERDGFLLEQGPDAFISEKPAALNLCKRLGIDSEIINTQATHQKVFVAKNDHLIKLPEGFYLIAPTQVGAFLGSPLFSPLGKLRMMAEICVPRKPADFEESVGQFMRRRFGREALQRVGQPMLAGIYSGDPELLGLVETMPRFKELEIRYGSVIRGLMQSFKARGASSRNLSGPRYSLFLTFKKGMETLTSSIASGLGGGVLKLNSKFEEVVYEPESSQWKLRDAQGEVTTADAVCLATSSKTASHLLKSTDPKLCERLNEICYESVATINFAYKTQAISHRLDAFGFVVPSVERKSLLACTFSSQKFQARAPQGFTLLRAFVGGVFGRDAFSRDDKDLQGAVERDLRQFLGIEGAPLFSQMHRYPQSMVQYHLGHRQRVARIEDQLKEFPGLFLTGSAYRGTGIPDCITDAQNQAERIFRCLKP